LRDELIPELEISLTPSKLSDNYKVDLFGLDEDFMIYLALNKVLPGEHNDDVHFMPLTKAVQFITMIRDTYRVYRATRRG
jgi:hypothetical protein